MAKNRKIPFGYMMQNGEITTTPKEVLAIVTIFRSYLNGDSLTAIAQSMKVPTNEGTTWNAERCIAYLDKDRTILKNKRNVLMLYGVYLSLSAR